ncbi:hypothetical protein ECC02_007415 [Trypanosoma cruzi]|uniref:Mucin TcMUCII n=1 Tax=Trypanosoma cruzi TaxID=5693 RepID=A0A7J6XYS5_TRYCR|nr:hypothetical protein ECC02_007415 [Trypanosoma cruzi]
MLRKRHQILLLRPPLRQTHQPRRPPLRQRHQVLRLQRRQIRRPPAHRHVFAKLTAASAALRGCVPRCCLPHPRWRTPLWAEEVHAGCACQHSKPRGHVYVYCGPMYKVRVIMMIVFCFTCFGCPAVCSALWLPASVTLNASRTHSYARHACNCLCGRTVEDGRMRTGATWVQVFFLCFYCFTLLLLFYFWFIFHLLCVFCFFF